MNATFFIMAICILSQTAPDPALPNLVTNPSFEDPGDAGLPAGWNNNPEAFQRDATVAHDGAATLRYANTDPEKYLLCSQSITLEKGRMYDIGAWVKTQGVTGEDSGATICVEWHAPDGKYIGGTYPTGLKGDQDWTWVSARTGRIPENIAGSSISCYLRQRMTGTAWWDSVTVTPAREYPLETILAVPNYRAQLPDGGPADAFIRAHIILTDYDKALSDVRIDWKLTTPDAATTLGEGQADNLATDTLDIAIPAASLQHGEYLITISLRDKASSEELATTRHTFKRVPALADRLAYIDEHQRLILNGQPFFPLGMYWGSVTEEQLNTYADSAFNCLMPYGAPDAAGMDLCQAKGLKVIYSVKDLYSGQSCCPADIKTEAQEIAVIQEKVNAFRNHPALLAWYINDELGLEILPRLTARRQLMEDLDPGHPAWVVLYQVDQIPQYLPSFDVIGTDPYPIPAISPARAGEWTRTTVGGVQHARPVWQVPQVFNWACYHEDDPASYRPPTLDEMRSMAWQCIAEGANGLIFYSWFDLHRDKSTPFETQWANVKTVAKEIADMIPTLLSIEPTPAITLAEPTTALWTIRQQAGVTCLIVVNPTPEPATAKFQLPAPPPNITEHNQATLENTTTTLTVNLAPLQVRIFDIAGLAH